MFEGIKTFFRKVVNRMFPITTIQRVLGDTALTEDMIIKLEEWGQMYRGKAPWTDKAPSLRTEVGICREFANVVLNEMESEVSNKVLDKIYKRAIRDLNENLQSGLALGTFVIKPIGTDGAEFVTGDSFIPITFDVNGSLLDCCFIQRKALNKSKYYFRFERHTLADGGLTITNTVYKSSDGQMIGSVGSLSDVQEWSLLPEKIHYPGMDKMDFGYYRNPIKNEIDGTACGVSIFDNAITAIGRADYQGAGLEWEFESGERAVHVDASALKQTKSGSNKLERLNNRLYRSVDIEQQPGKELFSEYSPEFREQSILAGLEEYYRQIEFIVGLSYGDLSNPQTIDKTATEVKASKQRKYNMVTAMQDNLKDCLSDFVDALAFYAGKYTTNYEFSCGFKDSILTDEEAERKQDMADVGAGFMKHWEYRMKWYNEDEATAKKMVEPDDPEEIEE